MPPEIGLSGLLLDSPYSGTAVYTRNLVRWLPQVAPDLSYRLFVRNAPHMADVTTQSLQSPFARYRLMGATGARLDKLAWETLCLPLASLRFGESILHSLYFSAPVLKPIPTIVTIHDLVPLVFPYYHRGRASAIYTRVMVRTVKSAAAIITVSQHARGDIASVLGVSPDRIMVTPEAAGEHFTPDRSSEEEERARLRYCLPGRFLLYVGGAEKRKNIETLARAWCRVAGKMNDREVKLLVVARFPPPDPLYPDIPGLVKELGISSSVVFVASVDQEDMPALYRLALGFCFPSLYEGFGLPPLEAMASGVPVICSSSTSLPETVGDAGLLLDPLDELAWAEAMLRLVDSDGERMELRRRGLERAATFSWKRTAEQTAAVYRSLLAR